HFVAISGVPRTADKHGRSGHPTGARTVATRNGPPSIGHPRAWVTAFNTSFGLASSLVTLGHLAVPPMAGSPGRLRLTFPTLLSGEHSTWPPTATSSLAVGILAAV